MHVIPINNREFSRLSTFVHAQFGIKLGEEKRSLVVGRLQNELARMHAESFSDYIDLLYEDKTGALLNGLVNKITTNHTFFMRETEHFAYFKETLLPHFVRTLKEKDLRIWCAGCSTGEEPYTLAMLVNDFFQTDKGGWDTRILATDISDRVLELAKRAEYTPDQAAALPKIWRVQHFTRNEKGDYTVAERIRQEVVFRKFNLMENQYPFKRKFHIIFCRNVMIYFDATTKKELVRKLHEALEPGGYLFIGHSESIIRDSSPFTYIMPAVYRKEPL